MLAECVQSVAAQTLRPQAHLIGVDHARHGSSVIRNELAGAAWDSDYLAFLDDDDLLYPQHLELLADKAEETEADLVYSYCDVQGRDGWTPNRPFDADQLRVGNYIPVTVLVRAAAFRNAGEFPLEAEHGWEDWELWKRMLDQGCRFACVETATWLYRLHPGSKTYRGEKQAV